MKDNLVQTPLPQLKNYPRTGIEPELHWIKASDDYQVNCRIWRGKVGSPVVLYLHGIEGHSQWFENTAFALNEKGITVYAPDRRGSGLNPRDRGHLSSYKVYLNDIHSMLRRIERDHAGHPIVLWGNCWGAKAATLICQDRDPNAKGEKKELQEAESHPISGLVLSSPAIFTQIDFDLKTKAEIAFNHYMGDKMGGDRRTMKKWPLPLRPSMFTDNEAYLEYLEHDALRIQFVTSTFLVESHKLSGLAQNTAKRLSLPILILQAGADQIVDIKATQNFLAKTKSTEKSMRLFPDAKHVLDFDNNWFKDYAHLAGEWVSARLPVVC
ncbi:MAG: alpha/beta fold hydrolase [Candidatus Melainabacteria bacterium]|nr:alpha/beta fold hydrolase [Candidatus Melainabacteria bacterium]